MEFIKQSAHSGVENSTRPEVYKPQGDNASIIVLLRKIARYNKEHGTNLSYGKYVLMMSQGKVGG